MLYLKEHFQKKLFLILIILVALLVSCDSNSDDQVGNIPLTVSSIKMNDQTLIDGADGIPKASTLEIVFSSGIDPEKFGNSFSITTSSQPADYTAVYSNESSKVTVNLPSLVASAAYSMEIKSGVLGRSGEQLQNSIFRSFTTIEENGTTQKSPCLTGSDSCTQSITIENSSGNSFDFDFFSSFKFIEDEEYIWGELEEVIFVVHGQNRDAADYFTYMANTVSSLDIQNKTLIIAPNFRENSSGTNGLFWGNGWREGANSENVGSNISSFSVIDEILKKLSDPQKFPNLKKVFVAGHSSGATYVQHYALANKAENQYEALDFSYVVANNQYFYYPDDRRFNESTGEFFIPSTTCSGYNFWPYGFEFAVPYLDGIEETTVRDQQISRNTIYLLGENDTSTTGTLNTSDCAATLLGSNRFQRGENIFRFMDTYYNGQNDHHKIIVLNVGHDGEAMFKSPEFKTFLRENM